MQPPIINKKKRLKEVARAIEGQKWLVVTTTNLAIQAALGVC